MTTAKLAQARADALQKQQERQEAAAAKLKARSRNTNPARLAVQHMSIKDLRALLGERGVAHAHLRVKGDLKRLAEDVLTGKAGRAQTERGR